MKEDTNLHISNDIHKSFKGSHSCNVDIEIEKKFIISSIPFNLNNYNYDIILQGYISTNPVIRIRQKGNNYFLTCKSKGLLAREEFEVIITKEQFENLKKKVDYNIICKKRYYIHIDQNLLCELDVFYDNLEGLIIGEVEFDSMESAMNFIPPKWFGDEVTENPKYQNSNLCKLDSLIGLE